MRAAPLALAVLTLGALATLAPRTARAQRRTPADRYDDTFSKYSKRYFGPAFDWRIFKAQGMAESNLDPKARSQVVAPVGWTSMIFSDWTVMLELQPAALTSCGVLFS